MRSAIVLLVLLVAAVPPAAAQRGPEHAEPSWPSDEAIPRVYDWIQLDSDEWLKGELLSMYDDDLEFDSEEIGVKTFDWEDVQQLRTARAMSVLLISGEVVVGKLAVIGERVRILGDELRYVQRSQILSITPRGSTRLSRYSGKISAGLTARRGNVDQLDTNVSAELKHQRIRDRIELDYLANYSYNEGSDTANNQRLKGQWDHFITDRVFVKPLFVEWYRDPFQNLDSQITAGAEAGYQIFDTRRTEWQVAGGLAYQEKQWVGVEAGEEANPSSGVIVGSTSFEQEWTSAIDFKFDYTFYLIQESAGRYIHHAMVSIETEWTDVLDLDVSLYWDRTQSPQAAPDGTLPDQDDFRMVVALGIEF
jgi:hypothetical protein